MEPRRAAGNSRGSERREGTRVRSKTSPFARRVGRRTSGRGAPKGLSGLLGRSVVRQRCPLFDSSRPLAPCARAWSGRSDRQSGSSTPSRVTGALPPAGLRWPTSCPSGHGARGNGPLPGVLDLHVRCRKSTSASGSPGARRSKALRVAERRHRSCGPAGSDPQRSVRGKSVGAQSRNKTPPHARALTIRSE
jgi:hypothetical protein